MGLYCRYFITGGRALTATEILEGLRSSAPRIKGADVGDGQLTLELDGARLASVEISGWDDELLKEEVDDYIERLREGGASRKQEVIDQLARARGVVGVQLLYAMLGQEETFEALQPLWMWLLKARPGILQVDELGFYDGHEVVVKEADYE